MDRQELPTPSESVDIEIVSIGVDPWTHATRQSVTTIRSTSVIFCTPNHHEFIESVKSKEAQCHLVTEHLNPGNIRSNCHLAIARTIIACVCPNCSVTWVTFGDATINCGVSESLIELAAEQNLSVRLTSGVPSIIAVNALIPVYERTDSIVQLNARHLFLDDLRLDVRFSHFVIQAFQVLSPKMTAAVSARIGGLLLLQQRLMQFYKPSHPCYFAVAETSFLPAVLRRLTIGTIDENAENLTPQTTLFLPAAEPETSYAPELAAQQSAEDSSKYLSPLGLNYS